MANAGFAVKSSPLPKFREPELNDNLGYFIKKSKAGVVLIAINPFKKLKLYGNDYVTAYRQKLMDIPHVYAIADTAYSEMIRDEVNQSLIISGESGAGKTETAKIAMQYLGALGGGSGGMEEKKSFKQLQYWKHLVMQRLPEMTTLADLLVKLQRQQEAEKHHHQHHRHHRWWWLLRNIKFI